MSTETEDLLLEMTADVERLTRANAMLEKIISTDAIQAGLIARLKTQEAEIESLRERNAALMDEKNTAIRAAKSANLALKKIQEALPKEAA